MKITSAFSFQKLAFDRQNKANLLISATAPKLDISDKRKPLNILVAIDQSTSMGGSKIDYVRRSANKLVEHLSSEDRLGIITFDSYVRTLFEPMLMTNENKAKAKQAISGVRSQGCTNFSGAMLEGFKQGSITENPIRFIMLTDGEPTAGECNKTKLLALAKKAQENITITAFGYGDDHDPEFLTTLASDNRGNYAFIKNPDDALTAFGRELGGLLSCYGQSLKFTITPKEGVEIVRVVSDVDVNQLDSGAIEITVPDIYSEEIRNLVLEVQTPKQTKPLPRAVTLVDITLSYTDTESGEAKSLGSKAKVTFVKPTEADAQPERSVMEQVTLAEVMEAQKKALDAAAHGNLSQAAYFMSNVNLDYANDSLRTYTTNTASNFSDSKKYAKSAHVMRATSSGFRTGKMSGGDSSLGIATSNSVQDVYVNSFVAGDQGVAAAPADGAGSSLGNTTTTFTNLLSGNHIILPANTTIAGDSVTISSGTSQQFGSVLNNLNTAIVNKKEDEDKKTLSKKRSDQW